MRTIKFTFASIVFTLILGSCLICANAQNHSAGSFPVDTTYTVHSTYLKLVRQYPDIKMVKSTLSTSVAEHIDIVYSTLPDTPFGKRELHLDIFRPSGGPARVPAVVLVHGGGWRSGNKSMNTPMAQRLAQHGYAVVSVEHRLSLEAKYPAAVEDIKTAIQWIRVHASEYGIDPQHIAIGGASAGGQLASLIGATNGITTFYQGREDKSWSADVQAVIDFDGVLDFTHPESLSLKRTASSADVSWLGCTYESNPDRWKEASAATWIGKSSPPFLFINSSQTRFHAGFETVTGKLAQHHIYSEVQKLEGAPHSYWLFDPWFEPTVEYSVKFLNKVFNIE